MCPKEVITLTKKEYLNQVYKMDKRLRILQRKVETLRSVLEYHSPSFDSCGGGSSSDRMPDTISKIMEYEQHAEELRAQFVRRYTEIDDAIHNVEGDTLREVLERRYLLYQKWDQIAAEMHYSRRRVTQLHGKALEKISLNFPIEV